jgi:hypothetical protein
MLATDIVSYVRLIWNRAWIGLVGCFLVLLTGCGGFAASPSVSPGMFFLPGLGQNTPASAQPANSAKDSSPAQLL